MLNVFQVISLNKISFIDVERRATRHKCDKEVLSLTNRLSALEVLRRCAI